MRIAPASRRGRWLKVARKPLEAFSALGGGGLDMAKAARVQERRLPCPTRPGGSSRGGSLSGRPERRSPPPPPFGQSPAPRVRMAPSLPLSSLALAKRWGDAVRREARRGRRSSREAAVPGAGLAHLSLRGAG